MAKDTESVESCGTGCGCSSAGHASEGHRHEHGEETPIEARVDEHGTRRMFLKLAATTVAVTAAVATTGCGPNGPTAAEFLQQRYKKLSDEDKKKIFARIEEDTKARTGVTTKVNDPPPLDGVEYAYALNLSVCNGNRRCVEACARENNLPDDPEIRYIRVLEMEAGSLEFEEATPYYAREKLPARDKWYMPVQCHQCDNPPCVSACPVQATWKEPDGIVVVDYSWCIGCRFCVVACPYYARRFNFFEPEIPPDRINPNQGYLSNRPRHKGVVEKCTFCLHRTRKGRMPACLEACPTGARKFGNLNDPESEIRKIIESKRVFVLKEDLATLPRFYYFFS
jgi:molybdopterin-containing oxidoreductase family iron-sulfur binding subunit